MTKNQPPRPIALSAAHEDYLRAIYLLAQRGQRVTNQALSTELGVAPASATNMVKRLAALNLVTYTRYHEVELSEAGKRVALAVVRYHRLLELYLSQALGLPWDQVHAEADRLEHAISDDLAEALARALDNPTADPHGDPIPTREGSLPATSDIRLTSCLAGSRATLSRVGVQDTETLRHLGLAGLYPGVDLAVREVRAEGVVLEVAGHEQLIPQTLADELYVQKAELR